MAVIVIRYETTATARWTSPFIVRAFFNDTITVAVWTGFHVRLMRMLPQPSNGWVRLTVFVVLLVQAHAARRIPLHPGGRESQETRELNTDQAGRLLRDTATRGV